MIVTYIYSDRPEDRIRVQFRFRNAADAINRTGAHLAYHLDLGSFAQQTAQAQKICARSDVLVIYKYLYGPVLPAVQYWRTQKKKLIVDLDQAIDSLTPGMPDYPFWMQGAPLQAASENSTFGASIEPAPLEQFKWGLELVDAVTVASARLVSDWSQFAPVYEVPDYLNTCQYPLFEHDHPGEIWIGLSPATDPATLQKSGLSSALEILCRKYPQVKLVLCSPGAGAGPGLGIPPDQVVTCSCPSFDEWVSLLLKLDIGLAPVYSDFDLRLSPIHQLEFMVAKVPWLTSRQLSFYELSRYGQQVQNSPEAWEGALVKMIERLDFYKKMAGGEPFLYALGQDAGVNIGKTLRVYSAIASQSLKYRWKGIR